MRIGIDFRPLQSPIASREVLDLVDVVGRQLAAASPDDTDLAVLLDPAGPDVRPDVTRVLDHRPHRIIDYPEPRFRRLAKLIDPVSEERESILEGEIDVLVQLDPSLGVPRRTPTVLFVADLVPLALGDRHPGRHRPSFRGARRGGIAMPEAIYRAGTRRLHEQHLRIALERARLVVTPQEHTAEALTALRSGDRGVGPIRVLAVPRSLPDADPNALEANRIDGLGLRSSRFLLFTGSSHAGARIDHLVAAFNDLRGRGHDLSLVLAGEDLDTADSLVDRVAGEAIAESSYRDDIHLLGPVRPAMRRWLLENAALIVLPGDLIGFGSGLADAATVGRAVIANDHPAVRRQVGAGSVLVPPRWEDLAAAIESGLAGPPPVDPDEGADADPNRLGTELVRALESLAGPVRPI